MRITHNGEPFEVTASGLNAVLDELGYGDAVVATAVNGEFVSVSDRSDIVLKSGDRLEVLAPMQGG